MVLPCLMGVFNTICGRCFGWIGERISTEVGHLISYGDNIDNLSTQVEDLTDAIKSLEDQIKEAESSRGATLVDAVVDRLLVRMTTLRAEASTIITNEERSSDCTCIIRLRPNIWACYRTSKSAKKAIDEALGLLEKGKKLDKAVAIVDHLNCLGVTPNPDFKELESRALASNQIVEALKDPNVHKVGVYGMGGTGKTTLAVKIGADLQLNGTFNYVVLATVSEKQSLLQSNYQSDLTSIQKQIAGALKIQLQGETLNARAVHLRDQLQKRDKLLIILDDLWSKFELEMVGIPVGSSFTTKFKILMTSRSKLVLENDMDSTNNFGLDSLPFDDALNLFDKMVGGDSKYSSWRATAHKVVDKCGGIPILLATTGRALRNANRGSIWEDALIQLQQFDGKDFDKDAYKRIEVSYNFLENGELQKLLLLCAQLDHRSIKFDDLLKYAIGLDLFEGRKTLKKVSGRLDKYLHDLKGCCLLQDGNEEGIIKMHDVIHKFASYVAARDHDVFSVANDGELEEWPSKKEFENYSAISFFYCPLPTHHELPVTFDNPKLESFLTLMSDIDASFQIPDNFFVGTKGLKVMNLTRMSLSPVLVSSLSALVKLRTLCLDHCKLSDITVIGELTTLQALSLVGSSIVWVPKEIGELGGSLKLLDLRDCFELETIASGVISRLTLLEDLRIGDSFSKWQRLEGGDKSNNNVDETYEAEVASLEEFKNLRNLINLEIHICEYAKMFPKDLVFKNLETFRISTGSHHLHSEFILTRTLEVTNFICDIEGSKALMTRAESLLLQGDMGCVSVSEMDSKGFPELKHLHVNHGVKIEYIVKKSYSNSIFPKLETLDLFRLDNLERICDDHDLPPPVELFENLRALEVYMCDKLNGVFSSKLARGLSRLKELSVEECESMESIIVSRERESVIEEEIQIGFTHQLRVLKLRRLPRLISFCNFKQLVGVPCSIPLFDKKIMFPKLEVLELGGIDIKKIWDIDQLAITAEGTYWFQNLTRLEVSQCHNLSCLFTFSMIKSFAQLKNLDIRDCESIEEIVDTRKGEMDGEELLLFPKLESLELHILPKLKRFCRANLLECQSLQRLGITECPQLNTFIGSNESSLFDEKIVFPNLEILILRYLKFEKIWDVDHLAIALEGTCWFANLTSLEVSYSYELKYLFTYSMIKSLAKLKQLQVDDCHEKILLPKLEILILRELGIMKIWDADHLAIASERTYWFQNLTSLDVHKCENLSYLFTSSMAKSLANFKQLSVCSCMSIEEIVASMKRATVGDIQLSFPNLDNIELTNLPNLKRFCQANLLECQLLRNVVIQSCSMLKTFISVDDSSTSDNSTTLFPEKVVFPNIETLKINGCYNLRYLFTSSMVKSLAQLKQLEVYYCGSIEEILVSTERENTGDIQLSFPKLGNIRLEFLPKLKRFCEANLLECQVLQDLVIRNCSKLNTFIMSADDSSSSDNSTNVFLEKVAFPTIKTLEIKGIGSFKMICGNQLHSNSFSTLRSLVIAGCGSFEKVFDVQRLPMTECRNLPFQNIRYVNVSDCPSLTSIFPASLVPTFQHLERLEVLKCDKIDFFGFNNTQELERLQIIDAFAKVISNLKYCNLENRVMTLKKDQSVRLEIVLCGFQVPQILFALFKNFSKLDKVEVSSNSIIEQLFPSEADHLVAAADGDDMGTEATTLAPIGHLRLTDLSKMKQIWSEHSPLKYHWIPEVLEVTFCESLLSLAPPSTTLFKNLTALIVWRCPMLIKLLASSNLAKSLVNLKEMKVTDCDSLEEIVGIDQCNNEYIAFEKMEVLHLQDLNSLTSFCSTSDCNFRFPSLTRVIVMNCLKMKFFSKGDLSTPNVARVSVQDEENEGRWEGDLNSTIRQLFEEQVISSVAYCYPENGGVTLKNENQSIILEIVGCGFQVSQILFARLKSYPKLDNVKVSSNSKMTELFPSEPHHLAAADGDYNQATTLARIGCLTLTELPKMKQIWSEHSPLKYHVVPQVLEVIGCHSLVTLAPPSTTLFENLTSLKVYACDKLSYLFTSSMVKSLAGLKQVEVTKCESIEEIVASTERERAGDIQLSFPKLDHLKLKCLPKLKRFCEANLLECHLLQKLIIRGCPELKTFMSVNDSSSLDNSTTLITKKIAFPNMEELKIDDCPFLTSIFLTSLQQLKRLRVQNCDKMDFSGFSNTQELNDVLAKLISSLEYYCLESGDVTLTKENQSVTLEFAGDGFQIPPILFSLLKSSPKLDKVEVSGYSITQLFRCEPDQLAAAGADMDTRANTLARIGHLNLTYLPNLKHIWSEQSPLKYHGLIEALEVGHCDSLLRLAPPSPTLFQNLASLIVWDCGKLIKLVASFSTAESFVNLKNLNVVRCDSLEEIVGIDDQLDESASNSEYIVFEKLEILFLIELNSLTSFCSTSDCNFRFPSLNRVIVENCPNMKFFCGGDLSTPKLIRVEIKFEGENEDETEDEDEERMQNEGRWEGDETDIFLMDSTC